jgi:hypothetical protein
MAGVLALALIVAACAATALVLTDDGGGRQGDRGDLAQQTRTGTPPTRATDADADHDGWPARVWPLAQFVEKERGLDFKHPVPVRFLPDATFRRKVTADETKLTDKERRELRQTEALLRALGLLDGHTDLFQASNDLSGAGIIGYYSFKDKIVRVRGDRLTPATKVTLVHELTHALQDQYFDLLAHDKAFEKDDDSSAASAFQALVEGDASRVEHAYRASLSDDERAAVEAEESKAQSTYSESVADVPKVLQTLMSAPYSLGEAMLAVATAVDGDDEVDALFRHPPTTDEQLLDPWRLVGDRDEPLHVRQVQAGPADHAFDSDTFGELGWYLVLAERVPLIEALDAADGWGGDAYTAFTHDGVTCLRARYRADTPDDLIEMQTALNDWISAGSRSAASVERQGRDLLFESCDRGGSRADERSDASGRAVSAALTRTYLSLQFLTVSNDSDVARCVADGLVHRFTLRQLNESADGPDVDALREAARDLFGTCSSSA